MGISKAMDADEIVRKQMQENKEEIKRQFEMEMAKNVSNFWREEEVRITDVTEEEIETKIEPKEKEKGKHFYVKFIICLFLIKW